MLYTGIIDNRGLESFAKKEGNNNFPYRVRAYANPQRNAEAYNVNLTETEAGCIKLLIKKQDWVNAAKILKKFSSYQSIM